MKVFNRRHVLAMAALFLSAVPGAAAAEAEIKRPTAASEVWTRTELYFGTNKANGQPVTEEDFRLFVDAYVTPLFPDGLTLLSGYGQFKNSNGVLVREKSFLLILFYPPQLRDANKKVEDIRSAYKTLHSQESVLRVDSFSFISF
jgi:hypothetical protein